MSQDAPLGSPADAVTAIGRRTVLKAAALVMGAASPALAAAPAVISSPALWGVRDASVVTGAGTAVVEIESG